MSGQFNHTALLPLPFDDKMNLLMHEGIAWLYSNNAFWAALLSSPNLRVGYVPPALESVMSTAATDGYNTIWINRTFFEKTLVPLADANKASLAGTVLYVLLHEVAHILADHTNERVVGYMTDLDTRCMAVDYQVYDMLAKDGFLHPPTFDPCPIEDANKKRKMVANKFPFFGDQHMRRHCPDTDDVVKIYDYLCKNNSGASGAGSAGGGGAGSAGGGGMGMHGDVQPEHSPDNQSDDGNGNDAAAQPSAEGSSQLPQQQAREEMIAAAVMAAKTIGNMSYAAERAADALTKSKTPWQKQLANLMSASASRAQERKRTYRRIGRRTQPTVKPYPVKPGRIKDPKPGVLLVTDCSGSISQPELHKFAAECEAILASGKVGYIRVIYCDTEVTDNKELFKPRDKVVLKPTSSGGGTDFEPVWHWQKKHMPDVAAIVYLTDLYGAFGDKSTWPRVPVIWGATTHQHPPFGKAVFIGTQ